MVSISGCGVVIVVLLAAAPVMSVSVLAVIVVAVVGGGGTLLANGFAAMLGVLTMEPKALDEIVSQGGQGACPEHV